MKIYHGSENIIQKPFFGGGKPYNDYGKGFYCTEHKEMAMEWAVNENRNGYVNCYEIKTDGLSVLNLNDNNNSILHWLTILLENRSFNTPSVLANDAKKYLFENYKIEYEDYDIIIGYRADDSYFSFAQDFLNGTISLRQLSNAMYLGNLGQQIVIISKKAFDELKYSDYSIAESGIWFHKKYSRDKKARDDYFNLERNKRKKGDIYITNILDEEIKADDERLR